MKNWNPRKWLTLARMRGNISHPNGGDDAAVLFFSLSLLFIAVFSIPEQKNIGFLYLYHRQ